MISFFKKKKRKEPIYYEMKRWAQGETALKNYEFYNQGFQKDIGDLEVAFVNGEYTPEKPDTDLLDSAILGYFAREYESPERIDNYFKTRRALDVYEHFKRWAYMGDDMPDPPFKGLSIYLMQNSMNPETVKFGILLGEFYDVIGTPAAVWTMELLGKWPAFTWYGIQVFKDLPKGQESIVRMNRDTFGNGRLLMANFIEERLNQRGAQ